MNADPYLKYLPSVIAASAVCLARHTMGLNAWVSDFNFVISVALYATIATCFQLHAAKPSVTGL